MIGGDFQDKTLSIENFTEEPANGEFIEFFNFGVGLSAHYAQALVAVHTNEFHIGIAQYDLGHFCGHFLPDDLRGNRQTNMVLSSLDKYLLRTFGHEILELINVDSDRDSLRYRNVGSLEDDILDDGHHHHADITAGVFAQFSLTEVEKNDLLAVNGSFNINSGLGAKEVGKDTEIEQVHQLLVDSLP